MKRKYFTYAALTAAVVILVIFDLTRIEFAVAVGVSLCVASVIEDGYSGREGLHILLWSALLLLAGYGLAILYDESISEFTNNNSSFFQRVPFYGICGGVWGICLVLRSLVTGCWISDR